jgi:hypothetical protein
MSSNKFVSSIPNNTLEPVFLGGGSSAPASVPDSNAAGKSKVYVPSFIKNKDATEVSTKEQKDFKMSDADFPSLTQTKTSAESTTKAFCNYSNALKKDIDKPRPKENITSVGVKKKNKKQRILDTSDNSYSDYDSDNEYY